MADAPHAPAHRSAPAANAPSDRAHRGDGAAELDPEEQRRAIEYEPPRAAVTHEAIRRQGAKELERPWNALAWSGLAAGLSMGLSFLVEAVLHAHIPEAPWRPLVTALGYPVGFLAVILGSQQLFTENTLTPMMPLLARRTGEMLRKVLALWTIVLLANLVGTLLFALAAATTDVFPPPVREAFTTIARESTEGSALRHFARAIPAGWIIAQLVWMLPGAGGAKVPVIVVMTWIIGAAGLAHVIVGAVEGQYLVFVGERSYPDFVLGYLLPVLAGNVIGGVVLTAAVNHAQVASET